ncbi:hypothetical protein BDR03DRAFT_968637 [Suillus americanus]|nr:hypothetical protein BDR03DRAFT_968637 [Suillus americanus]
MKPWILAQSYHSEFVSTAIRSLFCLIKPLKYFKTWTITTDRRRWPKRGRGSFAGPGHGGKEDTNTPHPDDLTNHHGSMDSVPSTSPSIHVDPISPTAAASAATNSASATRATGSTAFSTASDPSAADLIQTHPIPVLHFPGTLIHSGFELARDKDES